MTRSSFRAAILAGLLSVVGIGGTQVLAHEGVRHTPEKSTTATKASEPIEERKAKLTGEVNELYIRTVKPTFETKCFDCHATGRELPWYAHVPGPKQLIAKDLREAKRHMEMSRDIPFAGHGTLLDDLTAIEQVVKRDAMPPLRYKLLHWRSGLSDKDKETIQEWIDESRVLFSGMGSIKNKSAQDKQSPSECCTTGPTKNQKKVEEK